MAVGDYEIARKLALSGKGPLGLTGKYLRYYKELRLAMLYHKDDVQRLIQKTEKKPTPTPTPQETTPEIFKTGTKISSGPQAVKEFFEEKTKTSDISQLNAQPKVPVELLNKYKREQEQRQQFGTIERPTTPISDQNIEIRTSPYVEERPTGETYHGVPVVEYTYVNPNVIGEPQERPATPQEIQQFQEQKKATALVQISKEKPSKLRKSQTFQNIVGQWEQIKSEPFIGTEKERRGFETKAINVLSPVVGTKTASFAVGTGSAFIPWTKGEMIKDVAIYMISKKVGSALRFTEIGAVKVSSKVGGLSFLPKAFKVGEFTAGATLTGVYAYNVGKGVYTASGYYEKGKVFGTSTKEAILVGAGFSRGRFPRKPPTSFEDYYRFGEKKSSNKRPKQSKFMKDFYLRELEGSIARQEELRKIEFKQNLQKEFILRGLQNAVSKRLKVGKPFIESIHGHPTKEFQQYNTLKNLNFKLIEAINYYSQKRQPLRVFIQKGTGGKGIKTKKETLFKNNFLLKLNIPQEIKGMKGGFEYGLLGKSTSRRQSKFMKDFYLRELEGSIARQKEQEIFRKRRENFVKYFNERKKRSKNMLKIEEIGGVKLSVNERYIQIPKVTSSIKAIEENKIPQIKLMNLQVSKSIPTPYEAIMVQSKAQLIMQNKKIKQPTKIINIPSYKSLESSLLKTRHKFKSKSKKKAMVFAYAFKQKKVVSSNKAFVEAKQSTFKVGELTTHAKAKLAKYLERKSFVQSTTLAYVTAGVKVFKQRGRTIKAIQKSKIGFSKSKQIIKPKQSRSFYPVLIRRFGKFRVAGYGRTPMEAITIGKSIVGRTLARTFTIKGTKPSKVKGFRTKKEKKGLVFIEPSKRALSTKSELAEIFHFRKLKGGYVQNV